MCRTSTAPGKRNRVAQYRQMFIAKFKQSLVNENIAEPEEKAEFLMRMLWGALSQIRLSGTIQVAKPMANQVLATIEAW